MFKILTSLVLFMFIENGFCRTIDTTEAAEDNSVLVTSKNYLESSSSTDILQKDDYNGGRFARHIGGGGIFGGAGIIGGGGFSTPVFATPVSVVSTIPVITTVPVITAVPSYPVYGGYGGYSGGYGGYGGGFGAGFGIAKIKVKGFGIGGGFLG